MRLFQKMRLGNNQKIKLDLIENVMKYYLPGVATLSSQSFVDEIATVWVKKP
jgi:hypothetical protein